MRSTLLLVFVMLFFVRTNAQEDSLALDPEPISVATATTKGILVDMSNPDDVTLALRKIHTFRYLETLVLEGESDEKDLRKLFYRISSSRNLSHLVLREIAIKEVPENISGIKMVRSLTVEGSTDLNYQKLFQDIRNMKLSELHLVDNDLKKIPSEISEIKNLKKIQLSGSLQMDYVDFVDRLSSLPNLTTLCIPLNYITELPKNIDKLTGLQVLDVSNNSLSELPAEMSALKTINNLSIYGNLLVNPVRDIEKLKGNNIKFLALDKEISGEELEQIKKAFPFAEIDFPVNRDVIPEKTVTEPKEPEYSGAIKLKKDLRILSGAYLSYPSLFQGIVYRFDTLTFEQRYNDVRYAGVFQTIPNSAGDMPGSFYLSPKQVYSEGRDKNEICFYIPFPYMQVNTNYPELRAFTGMYWVYKGPMTKKQFRRTVILSKNKIYRRFRFPKKAPKAWNDVRVDFDANNSQFLFTLKSDTGFVQFNAYPMMKSMAREKVIETYNRRIQLYKKSLQRRADRFNRNLARNRNAYDNAFRLTEDFAWRVLQRLMSNDERLLSRKQWLEYYDALVANEMQALDRSKPSITFINRAFTVRGYFTSMMVPLAGGRPEGTPSEYGNREVNIDFVDKEGGGKLAVKSILIVNNKNKTILQTNGTLGLSAVQLNVKQFMSCTILVELRNGNIGVVVSDELDGYNLERNKIYAFRTIVFDRNLNTIGDLMGAALK